MPKAKAVTREDGKVCGYAVECPGCGHWHVFNVSIPGEENRPGRPVWTFSGDLEKPTFEPSMLTWAGEKGGMRQQVCHSFVRNGVIDFLGDTTAHDLRGKHPLPEIE